MIKLSCQECDFKDFEAEENPVYCPECESTDIVDLTEADKAWEFKKKVELPENFDMDWDGLLDQFNRVQDNDPDLYMEISKQREASRSIIQKAKIKLLSPDHVVVHNTRVFRWYSKLAYELDTSIGEAIKMLEEDTQYIRDKLGLGDTSSFEVNNVDAMDTQDVEETTKAELEAALQDD